jgi:dTDP-4-dehydrorhamnose 3,5-epimerase
MIFEATPLAGLLTVKPEKRHDERGYFSRLWCDHEFPAAGVPFVPRQISASYNVTAGTLRGMHWQAAPHAEAKLVRATRGAIFDVAVDLRPGSPTRHRWFATELSAENGRSLLIAPGLAHGFQTLADDTEVLYAMDAPYAGDAAAGVRWDDPAFAIAWPEPPPAGRTISERDASWPLR